MQNFYIFLDIDGVMWDIKSLKEEKKSIIGSLIKGVASDKSLEALQYLINNLKQDYTPIIVISSERRRNLGNVEKVLMQDVLKCKFDTTDFKMFKSRGKLVKEYLERVGEKNNYIIIDDFVGTYKNHFDMKKVIKTTIFNEGLTKDKIDKHFMCNKESYEIFWNGCKN